MDFTAKAACNKAITVEPTNNLSDARDLMIRYNISKVIVVANNNPNGMVTEKAIAGFLFKNTHEPLDASSGTIILNNFPPLPSYFIRTRHVS